MLGPYKLREALHDRYKYSPTYFSIKAHAKLAAKRAIASVFSALFGGRNRFSILLSAMWQRFGKETRFLSNSWSFIDLSRCQTSDFCYVLLGFVDGGSNLLSTWPHLLPQYHPYIKNKPIYENLSRVLTKINRGHLVGIKKPGFCGGYR